VYISWTLDHASNRNECRAVTKSGHFCDWAEGIGELESNVARSFESFFILLIKSHLSHATYFSRNVLPLASNGETSAGKTVEWGHMKSKKKLAVEWVAMEVETVPVVSATGLEIRAVDRFLRFTRTHNPNFARYSAANDPRSGKPVLVLA
jgi:hypothetical protein